MTCAIVTSAYAENYSEKSIKEVLKPYADTLVELNKELGVNYCLVSTDDMDEAEEKEMCDFFCSMSIEDFKNYIYEAYQNETDANKWNQCATFDISSQNESTMSIIDPISPQSYNQIQRCYYNSTQNYLYIYATLFYADGHERYASINTVGYLASSYPAYVVNSYESTLSADQRYAYITYYCTSYITQYLISTNNQPVYVTFTAGDGDIIVPQPV